MLTPEQPATDIVVAATNSELSAPATELRELIAAARAGMPPEALEKLVGLCERVSDRRAEQEFNIAKAAFQRTCPKIVRRSENPQFMVTRAGVKQPARYADLDDIATTIRDTLAENSLSYNWGDAVVNGDQMTLTCVLAHVGGHRKTASVTLPIDNRAGASPQQKYGAAMTYAQRYSLIAVLGLTSCDDDTDGQGGPPGPMGTITFNQEAEINDLLIDTKADRAKFLAYLGLAGDAKLSMIPARDYQRAIMALGRKKARP